MTALLAVEQPLTEAQGWWLVIEVGVIALCALVTLVLALVARSAVAKRTNSRTINEPPPL